MTVICFKVTFVLILRDELELHIFLYEQLHFRPPEPQIFESRSKNVYPLNSFLMNETKKN